MGKTVRGHSQGHSAPVPCRCRRDGGSQPRAPGQLRKLVCHWCHPVPIAPPGAWHLPDAGVPPGWAPAARQHLPAPAVLTAVLVSKAWLSPAVPARHHVIPSRSPLFSCLCFASPMVPGTQSSIVAATAPRVMPASVPGPVPPPLTPVPPQGTAPDPQGGQRGLEPSPRGWCQMKAPCFGDRLWALTLAGRAGCQGGPGPLLIDAVAAEQRSADPHRACTGGAGTQQHPGMWGGSTPKQILYISDWGWGQGGVGMCHGLWFGARKSPSAIPTTALLLWGRHSYLQCPLPGHCRNECVRA